MSVSPHATMTPPFPTAGVSSSSRSAPRTGTSRSETVNGASHDLRASRLDRQGLPGPRGTDRGGVAEHAGGVPGQVGRLVGEVTTSPNGPEITVTLGGVGSRSGHRTLTPYLSRCSQGLPGRSPRVSSTAIRPPHKALTTWSKVPPTRPRRWCPRPRSVVDVALDRLHPMPVRSLDQWLGGDPTTQHRGERDRVDGHLRAVETATACSGSSCSATSAVLQRRTGASTSPPR